MALREGRARRKTIRGVPSDGERGFRCLQRRRAGCVLFCLRGGPSGGWLSLFCVSRLAGLLGAISGANTGRHDSPQGTGLFASASFSLEERANEPASEGR